MIKAAGTDAFKDNDRMIVDVYLGVVDNTVWYARKSIPISEWDAMDKMDLLNIVHEKLQELRSVVA